MKILMGDLAKLIRQDSEGSKQLREFLVSGLDSQEIVLSDGTKYTISRDTKTYEVS
ncbi:TPA: hypothetical protein ACOAY7_002797 [Vibrio cholerae]|uniref:hypothetical protein n=1 Tax=Vibrio cholerae TaxID=666 RepID=UPI000C585A0F|nr:hypothetical protein [Vibrio phage JSF6]QVV97497.1 hypothetical protein 2017DRC106_0480 [Vibrio phage ICP1]QVV97724.1 hypothetical protein 2017DRC32_0480 [Vibrio phage ICP1]QVV97951.1 hypothetical protein 2017DRC48_0480 [Vibrio phage ICP1]QVV98178.1 hypothetical protein 2017DRC55_0480 [Vibrio phage ICP1]